jgi:hypothetical protein
VKADGTDVQLLARARLLDSAKTHAENSIDEMERGLAPLWDGTAESLRTVVTLSGGALVASISVVQLLVDKTLDPTAGWLLPISWSLFGLSIIASMRTQAALTGIRLFRYHTIAELNRMIAGDEPVGSDEASVNREVVRRVNERHGAAVKTFQSSASITGLSFILAFVSMIVFAILNVPF